MSSSGIRQVVLQDLNSILTGSVSPESIATKPRSSSRGGLCRRDVIHIDYADVTGAEIGRRAKPVGIRSVTGEYHFLGYSSEKSAEEWRHACEVLSGENEYWARSNGDTVAAFGLGLLHSTVLDVQNNRRMTMDCELVRSDSAEQCAAKFLTLSPQITTVHQCEQGRHECYTFMSGRYQATLTRTFSQSLDEGYSTTIKIEHAPIIVN